MREHRAHGRTPLTSLRERGRRAAAIKQAVMEAAGNRLEELARRNAQTGTAGSPRDFIDDARDAANTLAAADVQAALLSGYVEIVRRRHGALYMDYVRAVSARLRRIVTPALRMTGIGLRRACIEEDVLQPMADFFLSTVSTLRCDPNRLRPGGRARPLAAHPFGWSPVADPLDAALGLLITGQGRVIRWSRALRFSPLGVYLKSSGLAKWTLDDDGRVLLRGASLADRQHDAERKSPEPASTADPLARCIRDERARRARQLALSRVRTLWYTIRRSRRSRRPRLCVFLALSETALEPRGTPSCPEDEALMSLALRCMEDRLDIADLHARARSWMEALGSPSQADTLSPGNVRVIISRFRAALFG